MVESFKTEVVIVGGGFAGVKAARELADNAQVHVTLIDRKNHHLFQPLLYQVATAGLSPGEIATPIRCLFTEDANIDVALDEVHEVDLGLQEVRGRHASYKFDYVILACGAIPTYSGKEEWASYAPSLKTVEDATRIRRQILLAFEEAEIEKDPMERSSLLHFVLVGGGPTGVELAGSIAELSREILTKDFKHIDSQQFQITLLEAGPRLLSGFDPDLSSQAQRDLEEMGVEVLLNSRVTEINEEGVLFDDHFIRSRTVVWAAGVRASDLKILPLLQKDGGGRLIANPDLSLPGFANAFVCGDMAHFKQPEESHILPGLATVALQQGRHAARMIENDLLEEDRETFNYRNKGLVATLGRKRAVLQYQKVRMTGSPAWLIWLFRHIYYLIDFRKRRNVFIQWAWAYFTFKRGARLIVEPEEKPHAFLREPGKILRT